MTFLQSSVSHGIATRLQLVACPGRQAIIVSSSLTSCYDPKVAYIIFIALVDAVPDLALYHWTASACGTSAFHRGLHARSMKAQPSPMFPKLSACTSSVCFNPVPTSDATGR